MEAARILFDEFKSEGESLINRMVEEGRQESLILDFKGAAKDSAPMQEEDRKTLAKAISGFANSDGGLIVWGIDCRSLKDEPDKAREVKPIKNIERWLSDLNQYTHEVVAPQVVGVDHFMIQRKVEPTSGYAITFVPKVNSQPIMAIAKMKEQYCYYIRSGASFVKMEHFMVADRYQRRPQAKLELLYCPEVNLSQRPDTRGQYEVRLTLAIKNEGLGLALFPALEIPRQEGFEYHENAAVEGRLRLLSRYHNQPKYLFCGGADDVIYPGQIYEVAVFRTYLKTGELITSSSKTLHYKIYWDGDAVEGKTTIGLEGIVKERHHQSGKGEFRG